MNTCLKGIAMLCVLTCLLCLVITAYSEYSRMRHEITTTGIINDIIAKTNLTNTEDKPTALNVNCPMKEDTIVEKNADDVETHEDLIIT